MEERKAKNSKSKIAAIHRYDEKAYDKTAVRLPKGTFDIIKKVTGGGSLNGFISGAVIEKLNGGAFGDIPDLGAYARSAGMTVDDYIRSAIKEKMDRQDKEYTEEIEHEAIY